MQDQKNSRFFYLFLLLWTAINLWQAAATELIHDEAYYWFYTLHMGWGYFDHPPGVACLIWTGTQFLPGEAGVRLLAVLTGTATLWLIWRMIRPANDLLFAAMISGIMLVHLGGFLAVPDVPLILFSAVFLLSLKNYLKEDNWLHSAGLAIGLAGMAYSKYLGVLLFLFVLLPNLRLLRRRSFWLVLLAVILALIPHFLWQFEHDFPTIRYHFFDRNQEPWKWEYLYNYPLGQLLVYGPFIGFIMFPAAFRRTPLTDFERGLQWSLWGIFGFFLLRSLNGRVEANWTAVGLIPLLYLAYGFIAQRPVWRRWVWILTVPGLVLLLASRLYLVHEYIPRDWVSQNETHGWEQWAYDLEKAAGELPVLFTNNYSQASKYMFYTGRFAHSANDITYAGNHFDLLAEIEASLQGRTVFHIRSNTPNSDSVMLTNSGIKEYHIDSSLAYFNRIKIRIPHLSYTLSPDTVVYLPVEMQNPTPDTVYFQTETGSLPKMMYCLFWYGELRWCEPAAEIFPATRLAPDEAISFMARVRSPAIDGEHWRFRLGIDNGIFTGRNSPFTDLKIEDQ